LEGELVEGRFEQESTWNRSPYGHTPIAITVQTVIEEVQPEGDEPGA